jgi:hypothetical protein
MGSRTLRTALEAEADLPIDMVGSGAEVRRMAGSGTRRAARGTGLGGAFRRAGLAELHFDRLGMPLLVDLELRLELP